MTNGPWPSAEGLREACHLPRPLQSRRVRPCRPPRATAAFPASTRGVVAAFRAGAPRPRSLVLPARCGGRGVAHRRGPPGGSMSAAPVDGDPQVAGCRPPPRPGCSCPVAGSPSFWGPAATPEHPRVQGMGADTTLHPEGEARSHDAAVRPDLGRLPRSAATSAIEVSKRLTRLQAPLHLRGRSGPSQKAGRDREHEEALGGMRNPRWSPRRAPGALIVGRACRTVLRATLTPFRTNGFRERARTQPGPHRGRPVRCDQSPCDSGRPPRVVQASEVGQRATRLQIPIRLITSGALPEGNSGSGYEVVCGGMRNSRWSLRGTTGAFTL